MGEVVAMTGRFRAMGAPIDQEAEFGRWTSAYAVLMAARHVCEMDSGQARAAMARLIDAEGEDAMAVIEAGDTAVGFLENAIKILRAGQARMILGMHHVCSS